MKSAVWVCVVLVAAFGSAGHAIAEGKRDGKSRAGKDSCGADLVTVLPDGSRRKYTPPAALFPAFEAVKIDQGERQRDAIRISELMKAYGATWIEALDCDNKSQHLPHGLPMDGEEYLVVTGRGSLKVVRESRPGRYRNLIQGVRKLTFHGPDKPDR